MIRQHFAIPFRLPSLNEYVLACRTNPHVGTKFILEVESGICWCIMGEVNAGRLKPVTTPCIVCMIFHEANRKRDVDNVESAKKYLMDSLVKCGVLQGDSQRYVVGVPSYTDYRPGASVDVYIIEDEDTAALHGMLRAGLAILTEEQNI